MMNARQLLDRLLEDDSVDSMEGVPAWDPLGREAGLRDHPPASAAEARRAGVNWYIKGGRKYTFSQAGSPSGGYPQGSHTIATNRNARLRSFGMADRQASTRERDWPMPSRGRFYAAWDRHREQQRQAQRGAGI